MTIRQEQIDAMYEAGMGESIRSFMRYFRAKIPDNIRTVDDQQLHQLIRDGIEKAKGYGIVDGKALELFLGLVLIVSPQFDADPQTQRFLRHPAMDAEGKLHLLAGMLSEKFKQISEGT